MTLSYEDTLKIALCTAGATLIVNTAFHWLKNKFDWFMDKKKFKREYYFIQLKELYLYLYGIVVQSEYIRFFDNLDEDFKDIPFLEINKMRYTEQRDFFGKILNREEIEIKDGITNYNKKELYETIINKSQHASQKLIKLAVAYRYLHDNYQKELDDKDRLNKFQKEELLFLGKIVILVIYETNEKLNFLEMDFNKSELKDRLLNYDVFLDEQILKER
jgi:hypothetical protein